MKSSAGPGSDPALPNLVVIGAMKCGTSSLHYYLGLHPEIQMSQPKELHFFLDSAAFQPQDFGGIRKTLIELCNWHRGVDWYAQHFSPDAAVRGESTVAYSYPWYRGTAARMAQVIPDARLVYVVRDPIDRMISHYQAHRDSGREYRSLPEALAGTANPYVAASRYASVLAPFLEHFPRSHVLVLRQDELLLHRRETIRRVFRFLGVDESFWSPEMETLRNRSAGKGRLWRLTDRLRTYPTALAISRRLPAGAKLRVERLLGRRDVRSGPPPVPQDLRARLQRDLEGDIADLEALTEWDLTDWRQPSDG